MLLNPVLVLLGHCVASSLAQALFTASSYAGITVGQPFDLTWVNAVGLVSLNLVRDANHNDIVAPIAGMFDHLPKYFLYHRALVVPIN
jgi:hypothetical protein